MYTCDSFLVIPGEIVKESVYYGALVEVLGAYGQGKTRDAACADLARAVLEVARDQRPLDGFDVTVTHDGESTLYVSANDPMRLLTTLLRCQREFNGMSLAAVMQASGARSRNAYAQYEQGRVEPAARKLQELLAVVAPEFVLAIIPRTARVIPRWDEEADDAEEVAELLRNPTAENARALAAKRKPRRRAG